MYKPLTFFLFLFVSINSAIAQDTCRKITFQRAFQISHTSSPYEVMPTKDGGYLVSGNQTDELVGNGDGFLLKTNKYGEAQWINAYNRTGADYIIYSSAQLSDSGYMSIGAMGADATALQRTDKDGNLIWRKRFSSLNGHISFEKIAAAPGDALIVAGYFTSSSDDGGSFIIKFDEDGNILWQKLVSNGNHRSYPAGLFAKEDTILIHGVLPALYPSSTDSVYLIKMALANGQIYQSERIWLGENWVVGNHSFIKRSDDNYVLTIAFFETFTGEVNNIILGIDQNFDLIRSDKLINIEPGAPFTSSPSHDNGFVIIYGIFNLTTSYFLKFDEDFVPEFGKFYSPLYRDDVLYNLTCIKEANDSGYVIGGYKFFADSSIALLFKTDALGNTGNCPATAIPTPATESTTINTESFSWEMVTDPGLVNELFEVTEIVPNFFDSVLCSNSTCDKPCTIYAPNGKIYLCHVPPGNTGSPQQLILPLSGVNHHLSNHPEDRVGLCGHPCTNFTLEPGNLNNRAIETVSNVSKQAIIYPNPTINSFTVRFNETPSNPVLLTVFSADGKIVHKMLSQASREINFGDNLSSGIYFVEIKNQNKNEVFKIVKLR